MAYCDVCGNYDDSHADQLSIDGDYQPDLYYYWDSPLEEITIGGTLSLKWIVCAKYVSTLPTLAKR